jgi:hypothetical protein
MAAELLQELDVGLAEGVFLSAREDERAEAPQR